MYIHIHVNYIALHNIILCVRRSCVREYNVSVRIYTYVYIYAKHQRHDVLSIKICSQREDLQYSAS